MTVENPNAKLVKLLEKETKRADVANQAKTSFLANMSHEIRTPINAVLGMNEMILRETKEENIREYAGDVQGAAKSLLSIINDILDVTKIEAGKLTIVPVEYDFSGMIHDVTNMISFKAKAKDLEFDVKVDEHIPGKLWGDDIRVRQILVNLLNNAVKYTETGWIKLEINLLPDSAEEYASILFKVADSGIGIKAEDLPKLFVPFERIEEKRNRNIEGTGLGMNITRQLLDLLDSKLEVESEYGKGSVFSFVLEQKIMDSEPIGRYEEGNSHIYTDEKYITTYKAPEARILVVDDNAMNRKVFKSLLKDKDIQVDEASGGRECLNRIVEKSYHIIFMDHMMPDLDGIETFHMMKDMDENMCKDTPVVILTANAVVGAKEQYLQEGFTAFLSKPVNPSSLDETIKQLLDDSLIQIVDRETAPDIEDCIIDVGKLPAVDGLDWSYAIRHFKDKSDMLEAVRVFYEAISYSGRELERYYAQLPDESAIESFRIKIHSMKSTAGTIGILPLNGMAKILEDAARNTDVQTINQLMPVFIRLWYGYKEHLKMFATEQYAVKQGAAKLAKDYKEEIEDIFKDIRLQAEEMDIDELDASLEKLKEYEFEGKQKELFEDIKGAVLNLDVEFLGSISFGCDKN